MNTTENNKLIAEFMGYKQDVNGKYEIIEDFDIVENIQTYVEDDDYRVVEGGFVIVNFMPEEMRFHTSWDWLMPVVSKVREMYNRCEIGGIENGVNVEEMLEVIAQGCVEVHILQVHKGLSELIKWYNENKN